MAISKQYGFLIVLLIMALDITAGVLSIEAEVAQKKVKKHLKVWIFRCREPSHRAYRLGLAAAVLLALAHSIANVLGGCACVWTKKDFDNASANKQLAVLSLIFAWITMAAGFTMLIIAAVDNSKAKGSCTITHPRLFFAGGILCFIHGLFTAAYYASATAAAREQARNHPREGNQGTA